MEYSAFLNVFMLLLVVSPFVLMQYDVGHYTPRTRASKSSSKSPAPSPSRSPSTSAPSSSSSSSATSYVRPPLSSASRPTMPSRISPAKMATPARPAVWSSAATSPYPNRGSSMIPWYLFIGGVAGAGLASSLRTCSSGYYLYSGRCRSVACINTNE